MVLDNVAYLTKKPGLFVLQKGELIFTDFPSVVGPFTLSKPICLNCCSGKLKMFLPNLIRFITIIALISAPVTPDLSERCKGGCNYYVCKDQPCTGKGAKSWHSQEECDILKEIGKVFDTFKVYHT